MEQIGHKKNFEVGSCLTIWKDYRASCSQAKLGKEEQGHGIIESEELGNKRSLNLFSIFKA